MPKRKSPRVEARERVLREWHAVPPDTEPYESCAPPSLATAVPRALQQLGLSERWRHNQVAEAWTEVVGTTIARHAWPVAFRRQTLIIGVNHSTWLRELTALKPELLKKLRDRFGNDAPGDILFRIA